MPALNAQEVLARTDLAELLTSLSGPPVGTGRAAKWSCFSPDHQDDHPSVTMFVDRKGIERWRCWSDGQAGTAIDAVMIGHNLDVSGALRWLAERSGHLPEPPARRPQAARRPSGRCHRQFTPGRTTASTGCGVPRAPGPWSGSDVEDSTTTCCEPTASATTQEPTSPAGRTGSRVGEASRCAPTTAAGELAYVQVRNLDAQAPSKYSNPRPEHGSLPAVTFPRGAPADGPLVVTEGVFDGLIATQAGYRTAALISTSSIGTTTPPRSPTRSAPTPGRSDPPRPRRRRRRPRRHHPTARTAHRHPGARPAHPRPRRPHHPPRQPKGPFMPDHQPAPGDAASFIARMNELDHRPSWTEAASLGTPLVNLSEQEFPQGPSGGERYFIASGEVIQRHAFNGEAHHRAGGTRQRRPRYEPRSVTASIGRASTRPARSTPPPRRSDSTHRGRGHRRRPRTHRRTGPHRPRRRHRPPVRRLQRRLGRHQRRARAHAWVSDGATVEPHCTIGHHATVGAGFRVVQGSPVEPYSRLGAGTTTSSATPTPTNRNRAPHLANAVENIMRLDRE